MHACTHAAHVCCIALTVSMRMCRPHHAGWISLGPFSLWQLKPSDLSKVVRGYKNRIQAWRAHMPHAKLGVWGSLMPDLNAAVDVRCFLIRTAFSSFSVFSVVASLCFEAFNSVSLR